MIKKKSKVEVLNTKNIEKLLPKLKKSDYDLIIADTTNPLLLNFDLPIIFWVNSEQAEEALDKFYEKSVALEKLKSFVGQKIFAVAQDQEERFHCYGFLESIDSESVVVRISRHGGRTIETEKIIKILDDKGFVVYGTEKG